MALTAIQTQQQNYAKRVALFAAHNPTAKVMSPQLVLEHFMINSAKALEARGFENTPAELVSYLANHTVART